MKRTLYFLRDSVTGLYYTDRSNTLYTWNDTGDKAICDPKNSHHTFENAVIHTTETSVKSGLKSRCRIFRHDLEITDETANSYQWRKPSRDLAREREKLPNFGIEIVAIEISDGR